MRVASLHVYPVKATAALDVERADLELSGLRHDRRWAVVDDMGNRLNASTHDRLLAITAQIADDATGALRLTGAGRAPLDVPVPLDGRRVAVNVTRLPTAVDAGDAAAAWFSMYLGQPARLVWQDDPALRPVAADHGGHDGDPLTLADASPILLTCTASLDQLNDWIAERVGSTDEAVPMDRFKPNIVVEGSRPPFAEDAWRRIRIGSVEYRFAEVCDRCSTTLIDRETLAHGKEPIRTLASHRKWDGKTWFGVRLIPKSAGEVAVGDPVEVLETSG
ncbi:MOSC domain-containing protein [soil metagenome]